LKWLIVQNLQEERATLSFELRFWYNTRLIPFSPFQSNYVQNTRQLSKSEKNLLLFY